MKGDDLTRQAQGRLLFNHTDRISQLICDPGYNDLNLNTPVVFAEMLVLNHLEEDKAYRKDLEAIGAAYSPENRPEGMNPDAWRTERRLKELGALMKSAARNGVYSQMRLEMIEDAL